MKFFGRPRQSRGYDAPPPSPESAISLGPGRSWHRLLNLKKNFFPWLSVLLLAVIIILPLTLFGWLIFSTNVFIVQAITVVDARDHTLEATKKIIEQHVSQSPLDKNIFFVQTDVIEGNIISSLPQVRTVHVIRKLPGTIKAIVQEKTPTLLLLSNGHYYFVDTVGIPYEEARLDTLPGIILPTVKNNDQGSTVTLGVPVVTPSFVKFVQLIQEELPQHAPAQVAEIRIPSLSAREVHFLLDNNWELRFDVTRAPESQLQTLRQLLANTVTPEEQQQLEYIDLRIQDRVYYKTREAAPTAGDSATR
ncbi:MAG: cell division protein FtsQ/DivIB [Candidatus Andersenbacteria bacterium]